MTRYMYAGVVYTGKFGIVTDFGADLKILDAKDGSDLFCTIPRYGVWKLRREKDKHEVDFTTSNLEEAIAEADRDTFGFHEHDAQHRERLWASGGEACFKCGKVEYEQDMIEVEGRMYCDDCAPNKPAEFEDIAKALHAIHPEAEVVATGGGIDCIRVLVGHQALYFGTSGSNWGACAYTIVSGGSEDFGTLLPESDSNLWTECSSDEPDVAKVAAAIKAATDAFYSKHYVTHKPE